MRLHCAESERWNEMDNNTTNIVLRKSDLIIIRDLIITNNYFLEFLLGKVIQNQQVIFEKIHFTPP